jgi:hypothetical protein
MAFEEKEYPERCNKCEHFEEKSDENEMASPLIETSLLCVGFKTMGYCRENYKRRMHYIISKENFGKGRALKNCPFGPSPELHPIKDHEEAFYAKPE